MKPFAEVVDPFDLTAREWVQASLLKLVFEGFAFAA